MKTNLRRVAALLLACLMLVSSIALLASCAKATPMATLGKNEVTVNMYQFLLSRVKGKLGRAGYSVDSADFWDTVVDKNNTTYDEYFRQTALSDVRYYLAALQVFAERGLTLPDATYDSIDAEIDDLIATAGSKSALNAELKAFGVNVDILRDIYVMEAKIDYVREQIYGKDGSKVAANLRQEYLENNAVAFRHVLIRSFDYVYKTDENGDDIYYLPSENNEKVNNIAYNQKIGTVRLDEYGEVIKDANGENVYFMPNGRIAYDVVNGVRSRVYNKEGIAETRALSAEELAANKAAAEEILATVSAGDFEAFEALLEEFALDEEDFFETDGEMVFLYTTGDNTSDYLNDIADALMTRNVGDICNVYVSEYGYNVVMRYAMPDDAATNTAYEEWFEGLADRVVSDLFGTLCQPYLDAVKIDDEAFASVPSMKEIGANYYY